MVPEAVVSAELERFAVDALVVGVSRRGREEIRAWGAAERDTRFRIASITKPVTAALALSLLDADAPALGGGILLRHLLSHGAGLPSELPDGLERLGEGDDALERVLAEVEAAPRLARPGELYGYANTGFWASGALAAGAAGTSYEDAVRERLLEPLGMAATGFGLDDGAAFPRARRPSGGLVSTASDLLRLARFLGGADRVARAMRVPQTQWPGGVYGLGVALEGDVVLHSGSWGGYRTRLAVAPARDEAVVVLARTATAASIRRIADAALGVERPVPQLVQLPDEALAGLGGVYGAGGARFEVRPADGGLLVTEDGDPPALGRPIGERVFRVLDGPDEGTIFDFPRDDLARFGPLAPRLA